MKRTIAAALAGVAGFAVIALAVPGVATADTPQCSSEALAAARADSRAQVRAYLASHPDVATEFAKIKALPKDQRRAEWQSYKQSHPQEAQDLRTAREAVHTYRQSCPE